MMFALYLLVWFFCWIFSVSANMEELTCVVLTNPTIFGQNLEIGCISKIMSSCMEKASDRAWLVDDRHIFLNGAPIEGNTKYTEDLRSCSITVLTISNISENDVDKTIRCSVRAHDCTIRTTPETIHLEYPTSHISLSKSINITASSVEIFVSFASVYPEPNCSFYFQGNDITNLSMVTTDKHGYFYTKQYHLRYKPEEAECPTSTKSVCQIGPNTSAVVEKDFRSCIHDDPASPELPARWIITVVVCAFGIGLVLQSVVRNRHKITQLLNVVKERTWHERRRPIVGLVLFLFWFISILTTLIVEFYLSEISKLGVIFSAILCVISIVLLCFISNPVTVSIREGVKNANRIVCQPLSSDLEFNRYAITAMNYALFSADIGYLLYASVLFLGMDILYCGDKEN